MTKLSLWNRDPWSSLRGLSELQKDLDRWFDSPLNSTREGDALSREFAPPVDIDESDTHYHITADLPGLNKDEIKVELHDRQLVISGEKRREERMDKDRSHIVERSYGRFQRVFTLPTKVDSEKVESMYRDGVLKIHLAKVDAAKPKQIKVL